MKAGEAEGASQVPDPPDGSSALLRRFVALAAPYFSSDERWAAWLMTGGVVLLTLLQIGFAIRLNVWNRDFFNALEGRDWHAFLYQMGLFGLLCAATMGVAVYQTYIKQLLQLRWRKWLNAKLTHQWLADGLHYQLTFIETGVDNPDQRIAENVKHATEKAVEFSLGIFEKAVTLISFISILWTVSGSLQVPLGDWSFEIPGYMVFAALLYAGIGSGLTYFVGQPIVAANLRQNATEADYRFSLVRLRENSEAIAMIRGERDENRVLTRYFGEVLASTMGLMRAQRRLMWLTSFYATVGIVYPTLVASPRFFAGAITLGVLMQITAAFGQVQSSLNYFVDNYPRIAEWRSNVERLLEFEDALNSSGEATHDTGEVTTIALSDCTTEGCEEALNFEDLQITTIEGNIVIEDANTTIKKGERVLIVGPSGSGKSTLFRAISGLWPWGAGKIVLPDQARVMFMPQRPYLPLGPLRSALTYPASARKFSAAQLKAVLNRCGLDHLQDRLEERERWDRVLSGGEQQRLAFCRLLLHKPDWVFMDEATSALDEEMQQSIMRLFDEELAGTTLVSIAHRPGMEAFHSRTLKLVMSEEGARLVTKRRPPAPRTAKGP
ncbi:MAG: ABC transporter ATP-binding protein/permease, partial [Alphaproteobacteria bacterium]|nr:ABC transporter ATP-binding protein/permease [Alphaproteobacteria bacterium]